MSARHRWALFEMRFDWRAMRPQGRIISTHKTYAAAERKRSGVITKGERIGILRSRDVDAVERVQQWWPA